MTALRATPSPSMSATSSPSIGSGAPSRAPSQRRLAPSPLPSPSSVPGLAPASVNAQPSTPRLTSDAPVATNSALNKVASASSSLYQNCRTVLERLRRVPGFAERFLDDASGGEASLTSMSSDPVSRSLQILRVGSSLCFIFNALGLEHQLDVNPEATLLNLKACQRGTAHFVMACKQDLRWPDTDLFAIHELYGQDTNGVVKVIHTVAKLLDRLEDEGVLLAPLEEPESLVAPARPSDERSMIVREMLDSERKYVQDLEVLQDYHRQVQANDVLSQDQIHNLFLNINTLADFQRRFLIGVEANASRAPEEQRFGHLFLQMEEHFSVYEPYCANLEAAQDLAIAENAALSQLSHILDPVSELAPLLIKPVQRICKYPLLLGALVKNTPTTMPYYAELQAGHAAIMRVTDRVNETKRREENHQAVLDLGGRVEDWKGHDISSFGALLLHDVFYVIKNDSEREYYVYLFERIVLCCKEGGSSGKKSGKVGSIKGKSARKPAGLMLKGRIFVNNVTGISAMHRNGQYLLEVRWRGDVAEEAFALRCRTEELLKQWEKSITRAVDEVSTRRRQNHLSAGRRQDRATPSPNSYFPGTPMVEPGSSPYPWPGTSLTDGAHSSTAGTPDEEQWYQSESGRSTPSSMMYAGLGRRTGPSFRSLPSEHRGADRGLRGRAQTEDASTISTSQWKSRPPMSHSYSQNSIGSDSFSLRSATSTRELRTQLSNGGFPTIGMQRQGSNGSGVASQPPPPKAPVMIRSRSASSPVETQRPQFLNDSPQLVNSEWSASRSGGSNAHAYTADQNGGPGAVRTRGGHKPGGTNSGGTLASQSSAASRSKRFSSSSIGTDRSSATSSTSATPYPGNASPAKANGHAVGAVPTSSLGATQSIQGEPTNSFLSTVFRVKIIFGSDTFVIVALGGTSYRELLDKVLKKLRLCGHNIPDTVPLRLRYEDEDGDAILILNGDDLSMAMQDLHAASSAAQPTLVLYASVDAA